VVDTYEQEYRIDVRGLRIGMYVSRLDRPWLGTPYPLQGFLVAGQDDVVQLQRLCSHVFVDTTRGIPPDPRFLSPESSDLIHHAQGQDEISGLRKTEWVLQSDFEAELPQAEIAHEALEQGIAEVMRDLEEGRSLDLGKLSPGVDAMIESITRNPSAFLWLKAIKRKDNYAYQHALGCSVWAASFGRHLGLDRGELGELTLGGLLFDVGKTRVDSRILTMPLPLDEQQLALARTHVQHGMDILENTPGLGSRVLEAVATHHERHDGSGYPRGLSGNGIPMFGRIIGLIDSYDAMTSVRPYRESRSPHHAVMELYQSRGRLFQGALVEHFIQTCGIYPGGSLVELTDGRVGVVTSVHSLKRLRPSVMLLLDSSKQPLPEFFSVDLSEIPPGDGDSDDSLSIKRGLPQGAYDLDPAELFLD
jgi:HD-GYP domain-containing protein (c-di-GMP phosphodiesterase class II)